MTIERFTLAMMVLVFIVQIVSLRLTRSERQLAESVALLGETLRMQADTLHYLIKRVNELERRLNARRLPETRREQDGV